MLGVLLILTGIYALLPAKSQSTEIRVAVYLEDTSAYTTQFKEELDASASLYQFYYVDASTDVIRDVQAGDAECGFVLPDGFFSGYIAGSGEPKVSLYETSASTQSSVCPLSQTVPTIIRKIPIVSSFQSTNAPVCSSCLLLCSA